VATHGVWSANRVAYYALAHGVILLIDLKVACSTLRLIDTLILDVIDHVSSDLSTAKSAPLYLNLGTSHQMTAPLSEPKLCLAEATVKADLIKHLN